MMCGHRYVLGTAVLIPAALCLVLAACSAGSNPAVPAAVAPPASSNVASGHRLHSHAAALPIGSRAIPIGSRAIPIVSRAIPINFTSSPQTSAACGVPVLGSTVCGAIRRLDVIPALSLPLALISGYQPADLDELYDVPASGGAGQTIGIVVAYSDPNADADLATYRSAFGLSPCRLSTGCLRIVAGNGSSTLPAGDQNWAQELSIDLDMASAICPNCKLLVSEASSNDIEALTQAMQTAIGDGATVVSNSYTTPETSAVAADNPKWNHPGIPIVAGAGDSGYGVGWPASSTYVTAVGGTSPLPILGGMAILESAWSGTGAGCSAYIPKPSWQHDTQCKMRTVNDVSAIANPVPGVAVYDTYFASASNDGWNVFGGTSVATPIVAGLYALAGNGKSLAGASSIYAGTSHLNDIVLGVDSLCLNYLCTSGIGYDGPSGMGTPNGTGAF